jgi:hypothetical protein
MVMGEEETAALAGTLLPRESVALPATIRGIKVPSEQFETESVKFVPFDVFGEKVHPVDVPELLKSPDDTPETERVKTKLNVIVEEVDVGELCEELKLETLACLRLNVTVRV